MSLKGDWQGPGYFWVQSNKMSYEAEESAPIRIPLHLWEIQTTLLPRVLPCTAAERIKPYHLHLPFPSHTS